MARPLKGTLIKRGKAGNFYLKYSVNGKLFKQALKDENKKTITDEKEAIKAKDLILAPYYAKNEVQRRKLAVSALNTAEEIAADAEELLKQHITIAEGWQEFFDSQTRRDTGPDTLVRYLRQSRRLEFVNRSKRLPCLNV